MRSRSLALPLLAVLAVAVVVTPIASSATVPASWAVL